MPDELRPRDTPAGSVSAARPLDRAALERVLARAAELQAGSTEGAEPAMTEAQLVDLGKEVGLAPEHMRQALAEERTRLALPSDPGGSGFFGPHRAWSQRTLRGAQASVMAAIDRWMQREECLQPKRRFTDRMTWEARRDLIGNIKRGFNLGGRGYALARAEEVGATVIPVDEQRVLVRLDADFSVTRRRAIGWSSASVGTGLIGGAGVVGLASAVPGGSVLIGSMVGGFWLAVGLAGMAGIGHMHRRAVSRAQLALEQVLDRLEHDELQQPKLPTLADVISGIRIVR
jgi:hypothetical protein